MPSIHFKLITTRYSAPYDSYQCSYFSSMIKNKIDSYVNVKDYRDKSNNIYFYKWDLINSIAKQACIPNKTITDIYFYYRSYVDEYKNYYSPFTNNNIRYYNSSYGDNNIYYVFVELNKDSVFNNINSHQYNEEQNKKYYENKINNLNSTISNLSNENYETKRKIDDLIDEKEEMSYQNEELKMSIQNLENKYNTLQSNNQEQIRNLNNENMNLKRRMEKEKNQMNVKNQQLERNIQSLEDQNKDIKAQYESLKSENQTNKNQLDNLTEQHNNLKKKQEEEEHKKEEKKRNLENYRNIFRKDKEVIENKNIQESKSYITVFIINEFVKGFEKPENNKDNFTKSLSKYMNRFTEEFMSYCNPFIASFKNHSQKIIQDYKVNEGKLSIEHINFIVIGKAGIGKSSFINESLLLKGNKRAKEGKGTSVTDKSTLYCSEKLKMIRMWDTQGLDYKITQSYILNEIKRIVDEGLKKGPDDYINIILYCTKGDRFQEEDGQLINEIMKLYPMDNLPVIITQLQAYFQED